MNQRSGLIGLSALAEYCQTSEGKIIVALLDLQDKGEVEIIKRYFCPETHFISSDQAPYCQVCDYNYSEDFITTAIYVQPLKLERNFMNELEAIEIIAKRNGVDATIVMGHANIFSEEVAAIAEQFDDADEFCRYCGSHLYIPDPPEAGKWYCENPHCSDCDERVF